MSYVHKGKDSANITETSTRVFRISDYHPQLDSIPSQGSYTLLSLLPPSLQRAALRLGFED